ncbi:MAG: Sua5/YciO/YrdC/YwlC family protein [Candidatus Methanoperedens sp.]|nr:Sua5/YciO/YrdC/YwlC family protein [Candidatus Methanoperedens sp.]
MHKELSSQFSGNGSCIINPPHAAFHRVVLKKKKAVPDILTPGTDLVGIRYPDHRIAAQLIECAGVPITSTSANISGEKPPTRVEEIKIEADYRNLYSS